MVKKENGMTLVEVLAGLILLTLVSGIIWTTVLISSKANIAETSRLGLQQEANYIITRLQQVHRQCETYTLTIEKNIVETKECVDDDGVAQSTYDGVISEGFIYEPEIDADDEEGKIKSTQGNVNLSSFKVADSEGKRYVEVPTEISRYKTEEAQSNEDTE